MVYTINYKKSKIHPRTGHDGPAGW
jgi:hypothetical protein